jgi:predicted 3-demethylubiquinone-9 3-methyltransferase (glyoxalase superfamily)
LKEGGRIEQCGWVRDRWGLCWQIAPKRLGELMRDPDGDKVKRVAEAMLKMVKLDIAGLEAAARG